MRRNLVIGRFLLPLLPLLGSGFEAQSLTLANRVFVSQRSGNDANSCDNVLTPCRTFAGAVVQLNSGGEAIVLDSGGYGPVTITQSLTIDAPPGVTAFIHPPSGDAITIGAGASDVVTLRGLVLNGGSGNGIAVNSVGTLNVVNCVITGFFNDGIRMLSPGKLTVKGTDVTGCDKGVTLANTTGLVQASVDRCHLDGNASGLVTATTSPGSSKTTASNSTANNSTNGTGWSCGNGTSGKDELNLESCIGTGNPFAGLNGSSTNASSVARYSNCVFNDNGLYGVAQQLFTTVVSRGNNTITGNGTATTGTIGTFSPM